MALGGEFVVRCMQLAGWMEPVAARSLSRNQTPNRHLNARMKRSEDPVLFVEFDREDPNINSQGFRGEELRESKSPDVFRIAVLGDSVAYGYSVALENTFPARLGALLASHRPVEIMNFAISGQGTPAQARLLETVVWKYQPDLVVLAYVLNDPIPSEFMVQNVGAAMRATARLDKLGKNSQFLAWAYLQWIKATGALLGGVDRYKAFYEQDKYWQPVVNSVQAMKRSADDHGVPLVAVIFPLLRDYESYPLGYAHEQAGKLFQQTGIPYLDLLPAYRPFGHRYFMLTDEDDTHPNDEGHRIAAEAMVSFMEPFLGE